MCLEIDLILFLYTVTAARVDHGLATMLLYGLERVRYSYAAGVFPDVRTSGQG